jgi:hypothetical protein
MVYEFTLFSSMVEGRVIVYSVSMVLRLEILIDIPCLAGSMVVTRDVTLPLLLKGSRCPRGGVNWAFLKINARNKSYKLEFTPSVYLCS